MNIFWKTAMTKNKSSILDRPEWEGSIPKMLLNTIAKLTGQKITPERLQENLEKIRKKKWESKI